MNITGWITLDNASLPGTAELVDNATLLQVDITAIVGVFIFLTIMGLAPGPAARGWVLMTSLFVIPFTLSAMTILIEDMLSTEYVMRVIGYNFTIAETLAFVGFLYILVVFVYMFRVLRKQYKQEQDQQLQHHPDC